MDVNHPFRLKVVHHPDQPGRFSWTIDQEGRRVETNLDSYATRHEAEAAGRRVMNNSCRQLAESEKITATNSASVPVLPTTSFARVLVHIDRLVLRPRALAQFLSFVAQASV